MSYLPLIAFVVVVLLLLGFAARARRRQADAQTQRASEISIGTEVMTTSGLYGTVVARNDDDSAILSIAPGVEVKWAFAALRDVASLPQQYRTEDGPDDRRDDGPLGIDLEKRIENGSDRRGETPAAGDDGPR